MISEILSTFLYSIITALILCLFLLYTIKKTIPNLIEDEKFYIKDDIEKWLNSENGQKALFVTGGMLANGMKTGLGVTGRGGKFKLEDVAAQLIGQFIQSKVVPNIGIPQENNPNIPKPTQKRPQITYKSKY